MLGRRAGRAALSSVVVLAAGLALMPAAYAADDSLDVQTRVPTWDRAASTLGIAGSLWEPTWTADLDQSGQVRVRADGLTFADDGVTGGRTYAAGRYGARKESLRVEEKWADTEWAVEPTLGKRAGRVERVSLRVGSPGMRYTVRATVYADCLPKDPAEVDRRRCSRGDVLEHGGAIVLTMRPASTMTAPGDTSIVIRSKGLRYRELLRVVKSLEQVAGTPTEAGSAQMVGMCQQMVDGRMSAQQATAFAEQNGYSARVGSIDGKPMALTMDYRPDRFTLSIINGAVTECQYG
jgi:hypothetical protein